MLLMIVHGIKLTQLSMLGLISFPGGMDAAALLRQLERADAAIGLGAASDHPPVPFQDIQDARDGRLVAQLIFPISVWDLPGFCATAWRTAHCLSVVFVSMHVGEYLMRWRRR
jgi:hypothetical protein